MKSVSVKASVFLQFSSQSVYCGKGKLAGKKICVPGTEE